MKNLILEYFDILIIILWRKETALQLKNEKLVIHQSHYLATCY